MTSPTTLLIATSNPGKLREVRAILSGLPVRFSTLTDHPGLPEAVEDAPTFDGNAERKALHFARLTCLWTLADDSGLEVDALGGAPGVHSARYAGSKRDDKANNAKLIAQLAGIPEKERAARFRCSVALATPTEVLAIDSGIIEGIIVDDPRGDNGFGYDPHFFVPDKGMTTAEMPPELKNAISHRARALTAIRPKIERLLALAERR